MRILLRTGGTNGNYTDSSQVRFSLQHFPDFEKEAIVSDRFWLESLAALGNTLFSGIDVKHFKLEEKEQALGWIMA